MNPSWITNSHITKPDVILLAWSSPPAMLTIKRIFIDLKRARISVATPATLLVLVVPGGRQAL
jgi:hypothetical protein